MSIENPSFENEPEPQQEQDVEKPKEEESIIDRVLREREEKRRAEMTPEELAEDDIKKEESERQHRDLEVWFERSKIKKSGTPEQKKRLAEEEETERKESEKRREEETVRQKQEKRAKMAPTELAEDDKRIKRIESTHRWFERNEIRKSGTPEQKKKVLEEEKAEQEVSEKIREEEEVRREQERRAGMTPEKLAEEKELYDTANKLLKGQMSDKIDKMIAKNLETVMSSSWPEELKKKTIITIMHDWKSLKQSSQETDRQLLESQERIEELKKEEKVLNEQAKKASARVREQLRKLGL